MERIEPTLGAPGVATSVAAVQQAAAPAVQAPVPPAAAGATKLGTDHMMLIEMRVANERKSLLVAYLLWFFLGTLGIHNFYLRRTAIAVIELLCGLYYWVIWIPIGGAIALSLIIAAGNGGSMENDRALAAQAFGILAIPVGILGILWFIDMFRMPARAARIQSRLREQLMRNAATGVYRP